MATSLREPILKACFQPGNLVFAGGEEANNKLELENLRHCPDLRSLVAARVGKLVREYNPDLIIPVPNGANWLGQDIARARGIGCVLLGKNAETKEIYYPSNIQKQIVEGSQSIVIIEDALNKLITTKKVLALPGIAEKCLAVAGIWRRGDLGLVLPRYLESAENEDDYIPVQAVINEFIPAQLPDDSELWRYAL
ncbi:MAG: hypothetical protein ACREGF_06510 [Candidatus Saccharimonadales bacterium]